MAMTELIYIAVSAVAAGLLLGVFARVLKFAFKVVLLVVLTLAVYTALSSPKIRSEVDRAIEKTKKSAASEIPSPRAF